MAAVPSPNPDFQHPFLAADRGLLRRCLDGEPGAWDAFLDRFAGLLVHVVSRTAAQRGRSLGPADRDDLVAEVIVEILRNDSAVLRGFLGNSSLSTYLTVIARRVAVRSLLKTADGQRLAPLEATVAEQRDGQAARHASEEIETLLGRLDPAEAKLVRLYHIEERSYGEISRLTGTPLGSIGPALSRARQKMRDTAT